MTDAKDVANGDTYRTHHEDDASSLSSAKVQAGVKGIEAIAITWTKPSLIVAYVRYVGLKALHVDVGVPRERLQIRQC